MYQLAASLEQIPRTVAVWPQTVTIPTSWTLPHNLAPHQDRVASPLTLRWTPAPVEWWFTPHLFPLVASLEVASSQELAQVTLEQLSLDLQVSGERERETERFCFILSICKTFLALGSTCNLPFFLTEACIYKGVAYNQGDKWDDNCQYKCECIDASRGQYRCTDR